MGYGNSNARDAVGWFLENTEKADQAHLDTVGGDTDYAVDSSSKLAFLTRRGDEEDRLRALQKWEGEGVTDEVLERIRQQNPWLDKVSKKDLLKVTQHYNGIGVAEGGYRPKGLVVYNGVAYDAKTGKIVGHENPNFADAIDKLVSKPGFEGSLERASGLADQIGAEQTAMGEGLDAIRSGMRKPSDKQLDPRLVKEDKAMQELLARRDAAVKNMADKTGDWQSAVYGRMGQQAATKDVLGIDQRGNPSFATGAFLQQMQQNLGSTIQAAQKEAGGFRKTQMGDIAQKIGWESFIENDRVKSAQQDLRKYNDAMANLIGQYKNTITGLANQGKLSLMQAQEYLKRYETLTSESLASQARDYATISSVFNTISNVTTTLAARGKGDKTDPGYTGEPELDVISDSGPGQGSGSYSWNVYDTDEGIGSDIG